MLSDDSMIYCERGTYKTMIDNPYEKGHFGGIPTALILWKKERYGEENIEPSSILFTCQLYSGYITKDEQGTPIRKKDSQTLHIDEERIEEEISTSAVLYRTLQKCVSNYYSSTGKRLFISYHFGIDKTYIDDYKVELLRKETSCLISDFLINDYRRMEHYSNSHNKKERASILEERTRELLNLSLELTELFFPKSTVKQEREHAIQELKEFQNRKRDNKKKIEELQRQIEEIQAENNKIEIGIDNCNFEIGYNKELESYLEKQGEYEEEEIEHGEFLLHDMKEFRQELRTAQKAYINEFKSEQENILQELNNTPQQEESLIPEEIRKKACYFIDKGYIKEQKGEEHYILQNGLTGLNFKWINTNRRDKKDRFKIKEMTAYIWDEENHPYTYNTYKNNPIPPTSILIED